MTDDGRRLSDAKASAIFLCILALYASSWVLSGMAIAKTPPLWAVSIRL
jgi:hypothetical protein